MLFLPLKKKSPKPNKINYEAASYGVPDVLISNKRFSFLSDGLQHIINSDLNMVTNRAYFDVLVEGWFSSSFNFV